MDDRAILQQLLLDGTGIPPSAFGIAPNIRSGDYSVPATYLVHGTIDDKVVPKQSSDVYEAMKEKGIPVEFDLLEGLDHRFDIEPECEMDAMYAFINRLIK